MLRSTCRYAASLLAILLLPLASSAAEPLAVKIDGNRYKADLEVAGVSAELTITFEDVVGLTPESLNVSATAVNPLDPALLGRLGSTATGLPAGFPMLVSIEPDPARGLSFSGTVDVGLYTHDLEFVANSPLRLYSAPHGGAFRDITVMHGAGSYRTGGTKGNFSEFLIVVETRKPLAAAGDKLGYLRDQLNASAPAIDPGIYNNLSSLLGGAENAFAAGSLVATVSYVEAFADAVAEQGGGIPNVWGASHDLDNIAGRLRAAAATLRFSLTLALNSS